MTNEEAIKGLKKLRSFHNGSYGEHIDMAIKALEAQTCIEDYPTCTECEHYDSEKHYCPRFCQVIKDTLAEAQPSEDCVSRQKALDCFEQTNTRQGAKYAIETLPSVTPQRPKGKWIIKGGKEQGYDIAGVKTWYIQIMCDKCGFIKTPIEGHMWQYHYCPNCGAEMSGGGEDEVSD